MIKLNIQLFGGRGAASSTTKKGRNGGKLTFGGGLNFSDRKNLVSSIKDQLNIDLNKAATSRQFAPEMGLNLDIRKLSKNEFATLKSYTNKKSIRFESNGVNEQFIWFKK